MPHFPRCERTQHKIIMAESGSSETFAAFYINGRFPNSDCDRLSYMPRNNPLPIQTFKQRLKL